jgi:hypothetical protein
LNFVDISTRSRDTTTSGLTAAILIFGSRLTSGNVESDSVELGVVENVGVAVRISLISLPVPEIQLLPV